MQSDACAKKSSPIRFPEAARTARGSRSPPAQRLRGGTKHGQRQESLCRMDCSGRCRKIHSGRNPMMESVQHVRGANKDIEIPSGLPSRKAPVVWPVDGRPPVRMNPKPELTSRIQKGGALLADMRQLVCHWADKPPEIS